MQSPPQNSQPLKPEIQAILDIAEIQGVPVWYEDSLFMIKKIDVAGARVVVNHYGSGVLGTVNVDTVLRWIEEYKKWSPNERN